MLLSSVLSACVTAFAGPISFVGIAVPHLVMRALGSAETACTSCRAARWAGRRSACSVTSSPAAVFAPTELSISSVTAVFGAPVVIWLLIRRQTQEGER